MKNLTITLREDVAQWLRIEAAKAGLSMSAFVGDMLESRMGRGKEQIAGLEFFLSGPGFPGLSADLPKRDELYDRESFRRHEHSDLRAGSVRNSKEASGGKPSKTNDGGSNAAVKSAKSK